MIATEFETFRLMAHIAIMGKITYFIKEGNEHLYKRDIKKMRSVCLSGFSPSGCFSSPLV